MTRFLGAQLARMDIDRMEVPEEELAKLDLTKISFIELMQMARRAPNEFDKESEKIRRKFFMVFSEIFWAQKEEIKSGFPNSEETRDQFMANPRPFLVMVRMISRHLGAFVFNAANQLFVDPRTRDVLMLVQNDLDRDKDAKGHARMPLNAHFYTELVSGMNQVCLYAELVHQLYEAKHGTRMPPELLKATLRSSFFKNIALSMARGGIFLERPFFTHTYGREEGQIASFNLDAFDLVERRGIALPVLKEDIESSVQAQVDFNKDAEGKSGMCPASIAGESGNSGAIIKEFTDWVSELLCEHYVPIVCAENQCPPSVG